MATKKTTKRKVNGPQKGTIGVKGKLGVQKKKPTKKVDKSKYKSNRTLKGRIG